jgi:hypothetical protein
MRSEGWGEETQAELIGNQMVRDAAVLGLTRKEFAAWQRAYAMDCATCEVGQTPWSRLKPFRYHKDGVLHMGRACPCQLKRIT